MEEKEEKIMDFFRVVVVIVGVCRVYCCTINFILYINFISLINLLPHTAHIFYLSCFLYLFYPFIISILIYPARHEKYLLYSLHDFRFMPFCLYYPMVVDLRFQPRH